MKLYTYDLPFRGTRRRGIIIELTREDGSKSLGEVAPLPNWNVETFDDALEQLKGPMLQHMLLPSVAFGLETASLGLNPPKLPLTFPLSSLLMGSVDEILKKADLCAHAGIKSVKVKLSGHSHADALKIVHALKDSFSLRIDLNRAWTKERALEFFAHFKPEDFDYIEEPCEKVEDLFDFTYPLAVDESLRDTPLDLLLRLPSLKAFIFKPTLQGGYTVGEVLARAAKERNLDLIFSSAFETGVGISQIALLAHHLGVPIKPLGLDTYSYLEQDILQTPLNISQGYLHLDELFNVNKELLHALPYPSCSTSVC